MTPPLAAKTAPAVGVMARAPADGDGEDEDEDEVMALPLAEAAAAATAGGRVMSPPPPPLRRSIDRSSISSMPRLFSPLFATAPQYSLSPSIGGRKPLIKMSFPVSRRRRRRSSC